MEISPCCGVALLLSHSGAVLASLSPGGGDDPGGAGRVRDCPAGRAPHRVVHCPTLGLVAGVAVVGVSLGGREGEGQETGQQELGQSGVRRVRVRLLLTFILMVLLPNKTKA